MRRRRTLSIIPAVLVIFILIAGEARAIPAFARRYRLSCSTCHAPFPKLKDFGEDFAGSGFILKEEEKERDYVTAGDDLLWLNRTFHLSVRFDAYAMYDQDTDVETDLQSPWGLKLMSGGALYKNIGYYFYFYMSERGEVAGIEDAYIHFDDLFGVPLDVMVGQFQTSDPLMKRELRLTFEDYNIYKSRVGLARTNLAYDRGIMLVYGIEKTGTDLVGILVNGNGKEEAGGNRKFDRDKFKNYGFRLAQSVGEYVTIGGYYYRGKESAADSAGLVRENALSYWGPDINLAAGPVEVTAQYLERKDSDPLFRGGESVKTRGMVVEVILAPGGDRSRFLLTGLYNRIESDLDDLDTGLLASFGSDPMAYHTATLSATYLVARNLRLIAEYTRDLEREANRFILGMVSGF
jgi:hypothetical protein